MNPNHSISSLHAFLRPCLLGLLLIGALPVLALDEGPRNVKFEMKTAPSPGSRPPSSLGEMALAIKPEQWRLAETENFIIHYRRISEAQQAVREIEFHLWFVAKALGASKEQYQRKSHVFIFRADEWDSFLAKTGEPTWFGSFARGDELFLNVRGGSGGFDSGLLAHETAHAVVARIYPRARWPVWLNEGFAEYMGGASTSARRSVYSTHYQPTLTRGYLSVEQVTAISAYPTDREEVHALYQSSEKLVRFLMNDLPKERFPRFVDQILAGNSFDTAFLAVYSDRIQTMDAFNRQYARFVR